MSEERFSVPEDLFSSPYGNRWQKNCSGGLPAAVASVLQGTFERHGQEIYRDLAENLVACGGRSDVEGFDSSSMQSSFKFGEEEKDVRERRR